MDEANLAIIGTGRISESHVEAFQQLKRVNLVAACSTNTERVARFAKRHGIPNAFTDYRELVKRDDIDAVVVATWNNSHAPISIAALEAGKHVLCEKPMALNAPEAAEMVRAADESGRRLMVGMNRRFTEKAQALREFVMNGDLGEVYYAKVGYIRRWGNPGGWFSRKGAAGGGPVIDLGVHIIDVARFLTGGPRVTTVSASLFSSLGMKPDVKGQTKYQSVDYSIYSDVEDGATALIRFDNGLTLAFEVSWVQNIKRDRVYVEFYGDRAGARLEPDLELYGSKGNYLTDFTPVIAPELNSVRYSFYRQAEHFVDCIVNGVPCQSPAEDGLETMRIVDAIYESGRVGREVVLGQ